jgi:hypothetical protein
MIVRFLKAFGWYWYDLIIGDDAKIAIAVVIALGIATALLLLSGLSDAAVSLIAGVLIIVAFAISLAIDVKLHAKK